MARETRVHLIDDIDGSEGASSYRFSWQNTTYEIELNDAHRDEFLRALEPYISVARRQGRKTNGRTPATPPEDPVSVRAWARENGHTVSDKGRIPAAVLEAYRSR